MAKLTFDIPDAKMPEFIDAWAAGYLDQIPDPDSTSGGTMPNPETKQQFARRIIVGMLKSRVAQHKAGMDPGVDIT